MGGLYNSQTPPSWFSDLSSRLKPCCLNRSSMDSSSLFRGVILIALKVNSVVCGMPGWSTVFTAAIDKSPSSLHATLSLLAHVITQSDMTVFIMLCSFSGDNSVTWAPVSTMIDCMHRISSVIGIDLSCIAEEMCLNSRFSADTLSRNATTDSSMAWAILSGQPWFTQSRTVTSESWCFFTNDS